MSPEVQRCAWARTELSVPYHDREWGVPVRDDRTLFEFLILEGAQAGLSWETILKKRDRYRELFDGFDAERVARYTPPKVEALLRDPGIVRNRLKVVGSTICCAFMQATGRVNDHTMDCFRYGEIQGK